MPLLSKSKYIAGLQCPKLLWGHYNRKEWIPETDPATQARFDQGQMVGDLAKTLYPGGIEIRWDADISEVLSLSREALRKRSPLFEAGFRNENSYARADVLAPAAGRKWDIVEVKSSTEVKEVHLEDVAFQRHVYEGAGVPVDRCSVLHIEKTYVRRGEVDPGGLFRLVDVTKEAGPLAREVAGERSRSSAKEPGSRTSTGGRSRVSSGRSSTRSASWTSRPSARLFHSTSGCARTSRCRSNTRSTA